MALDFDGDGTGSGTNYVDLGGVDLPIGSTAMSLFCWCLVRTMGDLRIVAKADGAATVAEAWWFTGIGPVGQKNRLKTGGTTTTLDGGGAYATDVWIHTGFTYDSAGGGGAGWIGYKDGVAILTDAGKTGTIDVDALVDAWIGGNPPLTDRQFAGLVADVRLYDRALSAGEMQTVVAARGVDGIVDGLLHRWPLDELALGVAATGIGTVKDIAAGAINGDPIASPIYAASQLRSRRVVS